MGYRNALLLILVLCLQSIYGQIVVQNPCLCKNQGTCSKHQNDIMMCSCPAPFLGRQCQVEGAPLSSDHTNYTLTNNPSLFYQEVNNSYVNLVKMIFCPLRDAPDMTLLIQLRMEDTDGSLQGMLIYQGEYHEPVKDRCFMVGFWMPSLQKYDGQAEKVVMTITTHSKSDSKLEPLEVTAFSMVYEYPSLDFQAGKFLGFMAMLVVFTFFGSLIVCKLILYRARNRLRYAQAQPRQDNDIEHFSQIMPAQTHNLAQDEKDCVICLLTIQGSAIRRTPCGHLFHKQCIDKWGVVNLTCPSCRAPLTKRAVVQQTDNYQPFSDVQEVELEQELPVQE